MSYSKAQKEDILSRFHASGLSALAACKTYPDFPCDSSLCRWVQQEEEGRLSPVKIKVRGQVQDRGSRQPYPTDTKLEAVRLLRKGMKPIQIAKRLNIAWPKLIVSWERNVKETGCPARTGVSDTKRTIAVERFAKGDSVSDIAFELGISMRTVYRWADKAGVGKKGRLKRSSGKAKMEPGNEKKNNTNEPSEWTRAWGDLPDDPDERARVAEVRLAEALAVLDVLKAPGPSFLNNKEKYRAGQRARTTKKVRLVDILRDFRIAKSTYLSQDELERRQDKYATLRVRIRYEFERSHERYGAEPIWQALRKGEGELVSVSELTLGDTSTPVKVSEKVIRRIMAEEDLVPVQIKNKEKRYTSYAGETDERPANTPLQEDGTHDFHADEPGTFIVTDVTEFKLPNFKMYLSPAIDCFDGMPIAWRISKHPDGDLTSGMLEDMLPKLKVGATIHSDGGSTYRSNRWKEQCEKHGITRSMSRKAKSPDNARAEGFFGTLKQDFFYARDWYGVSEKKFIALLEEYLVWYRDDKIKKALGWKTLSEHRASMDEAA